MAVIERAVGALYHSVMIMTHRRFPGGGGRPPGARNRTIGHGSCSFVLQMIVVTGMMALAQMSMLGSSLAAVDEDEGTENPASAAAHLDHAKVPYPQVVEQAVDEGRRACREAGGTRLAARPGLVRTGDLTGDGRADYVVDFREALCVERSTLFSGTGGWEVRIYVARPKGGPVQVFTGHVLDYELVKISGRREMRFRLHGSFCGRVGTEWCVKQRRLDLQPFVFHNH